MRRDLELGVDPAQLVLSPPDRSQLKEIFRRFEFRNLLGRVDDLDEALPAAPIEVAGVDVPWREGELEPVRGTAALAVQDDRFALAQEGREVVVGPWSPDLATRLRDAALVVHDAKAARLEAGDDTLLMAYLIDPGRSSYPLDDLAAEYGVELVRSRPRTTRRPPWCAARPRRCVSSRSFAHDRRARARAALPHRRAASERRARRHGGRGRPHRHVPDGRDHRPPRRAGGGAGGACARARGRGVHARLHAAGGAHPLRGARSHRRAQGQDRLFDGRARAPFDPLRSRDRRCDRGVARVLEAPHTTWNRCRASSRPDDGRLHTTFNQGVASTGRLSTSNPNLEAIPIRTSWPGDPEAFVAETGTPSYPPTLTGGAPILLTFRRAEAPRGVRGPARHRRRDGGGGAGQGAGELTKDERNVAEDGELGSSTGSRLWALRGLSPGEDAQNYIETTLRGSRTSRAPSSARSRRRARRVRDALYGRRGPVPELSAGRQTRGFGERLAVNYVIGDGRPRDEDGDGRDPPPPSRGRPRRPDRPRGATTSSSSRSRGRNLGRRGPCPRGDVWGVPLDRRSRSTSALPTLERSKVLELVHDAGSGCGCETIGNCPDRFVDVMRR